MSKILQFAPFQSAVEAPFWHTLAKKKLDILQLSDDDQDIVGFYTSGQTILDSTSGKSVEIPPRLSISNDSLETSPLEAFQKYESQYPVLPLLDTFLNIHTIQHTGP
jgi:hypothetical protein